MNSLFVCYHHGCRGEGLAYKISQHPFFQTLEANIVNNRTVIKNDYCGKKLLNSWAPDWSSITLPEDVNVVIPSHSYYDQLKEHFPKANFVSIDLPKDTVSFRQKLYDRFYEYQTNNLLELAGECENRLREVRPQCSDRDVIDFTAKMLKIKDITFGDIRCHAEDLEPTDENKRMLLYKSVPLNELSVDTRQNSFVIAYEDIDMVNVDDVVAYCNRSSGSL